MGWTSRLLLLSLLGIATCQQRSIGGTSRSRNRVTGKTEILSFNCPEDFGYYPHPSDCTQYYVCVFGGALQESCTGGLMYSHELQTCDWPRNVICTLSTGGVSTVQITDPRTSASTPIRPAAATERLTPSVGSFSGSSNFPSQASQATDLFPVRIQGGSGRDGRGFTSSPSQQSLNQQTIAHVSRFPQTKALQESSISSVIRTNNPGAFQYLEKQSRRTRDTSSQLGTQFADFSNQDFDIRQPPQDFFQSGSQSQQEQRNLHPRNPNHPHFPNAGFPPHKQAGGRSAHTSFFELPQRTFQNTHFQNNPFGGNSFQIQSQFNHPSPSRSSPANSFGNFQSFSPPSFSPSDSPHSTFDGRHGQHPPPSHASSQSSFPQNHFPDSPSHHRFPQPPQQPGFPPSHLNPNFPPQPSHNPHFPPQPSHAQDFPFNSQGPPHTQSSDRFRVDEARPIASTKPNHFTTPRPQNSLDHNSPPHFNQHPPPQFPPPLPSRHFPPKQNNFPKGQFPPPQSGFPPKSHPRFPPPPHARFPPQSQSQFPPQTTAKFPPKPLSQFPPQRPEQFPPPSTSRFPQQNLPLQEQSRFPHQNDEAVIPSSEPLKLSPKPPTISEIKPQLNLSSISKTTPKPHIISPTKSEPSSISKPKVSNSKSRMPKPKFPDFAEFTTETSIKKNPSRFRINSSKPPRIPGTARQPELSRLSAVKSNPAGSQFPSSLPSSSSPHKRPLNSIGRPISRAPQRPKPTPAPVRAQTPRPTARPTSRSTPRPSSSAALSFDDSFYPGLNFTDADYYYYYDDLLYDYYDAADFTATSTAAPFRRQATTARPSSRGTPPPSRRTSSQASSGPATTDNSIPSRSRRPTLKPVNVIAPSTSEAIDIFKFPPKRLPARYPQPPVESVATKCDPKVCRLPDCSCGGVPVPGGIAPQDTPQIVLLTFDDSINDLNKGHYEDLFKVGRKNPNGCPIQASFYVSHEWTDYGQVQTMYSEGHEMASHSITHSFGEQFSVKKWSKEVAGQREILSAYGGVKMEDVRGMRAPFLAIGGNKMFKMLYDQNFTYDSSMPVYENNPPSWPYTLDYKVFHDCMIPPCPTLSYPGVWQVPMVMWQDLNGGRCSMGDACTTPPDAEGVYKMLIKNFERHYTTNRAPFGLFYHAAWFTTPHHKEGFIAFLDTITAMDDVWLTTNWQALQYVRDPVSLSTVKNYKPFQCNYPDRPPRCDRPKVCNVWHKGGVRYMRTCQKCPEKYPWTGNTGVRSPLNDL